jgi:hypothetical protein
MSSPLSTHSLELPKSANRLITERHFLAHVRPIDILNPVSGPEPDGGRNEWDG